MLEKKVGKSFIILGMGYVSGKHIQAIKSIGGNLIAYHDIMSVLGHVDSYFLDALYYPEFLSFDCFIDRHQQEGNKIDYAVILLPNHLHNPAARWAMNRGMDVIVEKPLVLYEKNLDELKEVEERTGKKVNTILQMRLHPETDKMIYDLKQSKHPQSSNVEISYYAPRGHWFRHDGGWKSDIKKSGGIATAIGVHLFDLASFVFGNLHIHRIDFISQDSIEGTLDLEYANVKWKLSVDPRAKQTRIFKVNNELYDFTNGFGDLHIESYRQILAGNGFGIEDARIGIRICERIRGS